MRQRIEMVRDETRVKPNSVMDWLDKFVFGPMNFLERLFGAIKKASSPSKGGRFGKTALVVVPPVDSGGSYTFTECKNHLEAYGVKTFTYQHDDQNFYLEVRETQLGFAKWLLNNGQGLRHPKSSWKNGPRKQEQPKKKQSLMDRIF